MFRLTQQVRRDQRPWHSYDFDLTSLNVCLRFLTAPEKGARFGIMDVVRKPDGSVSFAHEGSVELRFVKEEERGGEAVRRYTLDGPGLEDRGGDVWVSCSKDPVIVDFEIDLPDEPGMQSGKMRLLRRAEVTEKEWKAHVASKVK
ncbi:MAG: hypothetical protein GY711_11115 [bacterium]|nr:hypothetical protein [bacterium]